LVAYDVADTESPTKIYTPAQVKELDLLLDVNPSLPFEAYKRVMLITRTIDHDWEESSKGPSAPQVEL
jgi:hypothetical protein